MRASSSSTCKSCIIPKRLPSRNQARAAQNRQNRAKSIVVCRQGSRSLTRLRDQMMESSTTREYPSLIHTFFLTHTVGSVFLNPEDKALYVFSGHGTVILPPPPYTHSSDVAKLKKSEKLLTKQPEYGGGSGNGGCWDDEPGDDENGGEDGED
nr:hypothetical protein [Tanacetum cinerariifolium]